RAELLPHLVQTPEPPREPAARPFEKRAAQPRVALQHAAGGEAREGEHQLHRVAAGDTDDASVRVIEIAPRDVVAERGLPGRVEADGHLELLDRVPEGLEFRVVDVASADRIRVADHGHGTQLADGAPGLADRPADIVEG